VRDESVHQIGVKLVKTADLFANPHNPRRLFDKEPLRILKASVAKVGILVPLTVYTEARSGHLIILDGQRRWIVAQQLGLDLVPVNEIAEPSVVSNIVTMFQIHKLREDWELMPTALTLAVLMKHLKERNEKKLSTLTGLDRAVVVRCKKLLNYPKRYQDTMLDPDPHARTKADFFIELYAVRNDRFVNSLPWYERNDFTDRMLERYKARKGIKAVTDFRVMKQHITNAVKARKRKEISGRLHAFVHNPELPLDHLAVPAAGVAAQARRLEKKVVGLLEDLRRIDVASYYGEESLWEDLEALLTLIRECLEEAGRRPAR
jgi:ParB/RepB/Spo0J family partition protein